MLMDQTQVDIRWRAIILVVKDHLSITHKCKKKELKGCIHLKEALSSPKLLRIKWNKNLQHRYKFGSNPIEWKNTLKSYSMRRQMVILLKLIKQVILIAPILHMTIQSTDIINTTSMMIKKVSVILLWLAWDLITVLFDN